MSDSREPIPPRNDHDEADVQAAFDRVASDLEFDMDEVRASLNRSVGALVVEVKPPPLSSQIELAVDALAPSDEDEEAIRRVLETWESASPNDLIETWKANGVWPVVAVGANWIGPIDDEALEEGLKSKHFQESLERYPLYDPRRVTLSELRVVFLGGAKAIATYRSEERYTNGKAYAGNAAAVLMKNKDGAWKVALFTKRTRGLDFFPTT